MKWTPAEKQRQLDDAIKFLKTQMGKDVNRTSRENIPINLTKDEMSKYVKRFNAIDKDKKGYITVTDLTKSMKVGWTSWPLNEAPLAIDGATNPGL